MMPNLNPKQMQKIMKQMGIRTEELNAEKVIIESKDKKIIIENPQISITYMQGSKIYSVQGREIEESKIKDEDIKLVVEQTACTEDEARKALEESKGDLAEAILKLAKNQKH